MLQNIEELSYTYYSREMVKDRLYERLQLLLRTPNFNQIELYDLFHKYPEYVQHVWKHKYPNFGELEISNFMVLGHRSFFSSYRPLHLSIKI